MFYPSLDRPKESERDLIYVAENCVLFITKGGGVSYESLAGQSNVPWTGTTNGVLTVASCRDHRYCTASGIAIGWSQQGQSKSSKGHLNQISQYVSFLIRMSASWKEQTSKMTQVFSVFKCLISACILRFGRIERRQDELYAIAIDEDLCFFQDPSSLKPRASMCTCNPDINL